MPTKATKLTDTQLWTEIRRAERRCLDAEGALAKLQDEQRRREETIKSQTIVARRWRAEWRRCGKETCACATGERHGPYFYRADTFGDGRIQVRYAGRELPANVKPGVRYSVAKDGTTHTPGSRFEQRRRAAEKRAKR